MSFNRPKPARSRHQLLIQLTKLSRTNMTVISGLTYLAAAQLSTTITSTPFKTYNFLVGWLFIVLTQFMTHFLGEVYDRPSDLLNKYATPITGGTRVLIGTDSPPVSLPYRAGYVCMTLSLVTLQALVPPSARYVGIVMVILAWGYSVPPLKFNHRALGELDASIITSAFVPYFASAVQGVSDGHCPWFDARLAILVVPPLFAKFALFLVLNLADKRADWAAGKVTLPVLYGPRFTAITHFVCMLLSYTSAAAIAVHSAYGASKSQQWHHLSLLLFLLPSAILAFSVSRTLLVDMPYRIDALLPPTLFQSTLLMWGILLHTFLFNLSSVSPFSFPGFLATIFAYITIGNFLRGKKASARKKQVDDILPSHTKSSSTRLLPLVDDPSEDHKQLPDTIAENHPSAVSAVSNEPQLTIFENSNDTVVAMPLLVSTQRYDVIVVGAGVAGLVAIATLRKLGLEAVALERRRSSMEAETGADLALWPGAIAILKKLGVPQAFFDRHCFPLDKVHMCKMDFEQTLQSVDADASGAATILKTIDMCAVTEGTGERFVLVSRERLMNALRDIVPQNAVLYGAEVTDVTENEDTESATVTFSCDEGISENSFTSRIVIGADGARSRLREHVAPGLGGSDAIRFCNEVCYRGVLDLGALQGGSGEALKSKIVALLPDKAADRTMRINYGAGLRSSFGYMSGDGDIAYWWVKEQMNEMPVEHGKKSDCWWPEPLKTLHDVTADNAFYMHSIDDSASLAKWSSNRVVLVGDAAHVVTPNMGQGACLGAEDAFVITTLIAKNWHWADGHVEAFYEYERCRKPFAEGVASEARKQLMLGQLTNWMAVKMREVLLQLVPSRVLEGKLKSNNFAVLPYIDLFNELCE